MKVYLDNSSTTRQYDEVSERMYSTAKNSYGNPSSLHGLGLEAEKIVKDARKNVASALNAEAEEVFFAASGTEADNTAIVGAALAKKRRGRRIISTTVEHPAVLEPLSRLESMGFEVIRIGVDRECRLDTDALKSALNDDTILISVMGVNNEVGTLMPIQEIGELKDEYNRRHGTEILLHTDAVQALGKLRIDVKGGYRGADMISLSAHKIHGPKGVGALYIRKGVSVQPFILGGGQERGFRSGTENVNGIEGFGLATEISMKRFDSRVNRMMLMKKLLENGIRISIPDVSVNTPEDSACSILNVSFLGTWGEVILHSLEQDGIYVSTGSACSSNHRAKKGSHVLNAMGLRPKEIEGAIRFSLSEFTTSEEIEYTIEKLKSAVLRFRKLGSFR